MTAIPHTLHFIWLQGEAHLRKERPQYWEYIQSWKTYHPGFDTRVWDADSLQPVVEGASPEAGRLMKANIPFAWKANLGRYAVLDAFGGVYADTDARCIRSMAYLLQDASFVYCRHVNLPAWDEAVYKAGNDWPVLNNCWIASVPGYPVWATFWAFIEARWAGKTPKHSRSSYMSPYLELFRESIAEHADREDLRAVPSPVLDPLMWSAKRRRAVRPDLDDASTRRALPSASSVHYSDMSWQSTTKRTFYENVLDYSTLLIIILASVLLAALVTIVVLSVVVHRRRPRGGAAVTPGATKLHLS